MAKIKSKVILFIDQQASLFFGLIFLILLTLSLIRFSTHTSRAQVQLVEKPYNLDLNLQLAQQFLDNNQYPEAENVLLLSQQLTQTNPVLDKLWQKKHLEDPKDIREMIQKWEKILQTKKDYRDGYLQLSLLYQKLYQKGKAIEQVNKALEIDPNYEPAQVLKTVLQSS